MLKILVFIALLLNEVPTAEDEMDGILIRAYFGR